MAKTDDMEYTGSSQEGQDQGGEPGTDQGSSAGKLVLSGLLLFVALMLFLRPGCSEKDLWLCPDGPSSPEWSSSYGMPLHYGMNHYHYGTGGVTNDDYLASLNGRNVRQIKSPAQTLFMVDATPDSSPADIGAAQDGTLDWPLTSLAESRHNNGYNAGHLDGSAKYYPNEANHKTWGTKKQ